MPPPVQADAAELNAAVAGALARGDSAAVTARIGELLRLAVSDAEAAFLAGELHAKGVATPRDRVRAEFWYQGAEAMGHAEAAFELALLDTDPARRSARLHAAAAGGSHRAMLKLGDEARSASAEAAAEWYLRAAAAGNGRAAASLGRLLEARRLPEAMGPAAQWFARAEALDCPWWEFAE